VFILIDNARVYAPEPLGTRSILIAGERISRVGTIERAGLDLLDVEYEYIDATGCIATPGLIDPHTHLLGGSGEGSLALQSFPLFAEELAAGGITATVGVLGVDTTMKPIEGLLARVKALRELGFGATMWTGGYNVPPTTLLDSVRQDLMFVDEVIGAGEIAISDERGLNQSGQELAKLVRDTHVGGLLSGKAGLAHFHVGEEKTRLWPLREIVEDFEVKCEWLYPTHIHRTRELLLEAVDLANAGAWVDMDVVEENVHEWLPVYLDNGGPLERLTISSDADSSTPEIFYRTFCELVVKHRHPLELVLPLFTENAAKALKLEEGVLRQGARASLLILEEGTLALRYVISGGHVMMRDGRVSVRERWLEDSKRQMSFTGDEHPSVR
jgi:beta-aspartyl-dipeptidase (metallo-type)